jgi:hypothetical protein
MTKSSKITVGLIVFSLLFGILGGFLFLRVQVCNLNPYFFDDTGTANEQVQVGDTEPAKKKVPLIFLRYLAFPYLRVRKWSKENYYT